MKIASTSIFLGVMAIGLCYGHAPAHAQSPAAPTTAVPTTAVPATTAPTTTAPATTAPLVTGGDDKPWNKGVTPDTREAARTVFLEGNRLFRIPLFAQAAAQYTTALAQWKHPAFYFNLALAQLNLDQEVEARENLERALRYGEEPLGAEQFVEAKKQLQQVEHQLGKIRITCQTKSAEVTLDGVTVFTGPGSYQEWVKAKPHEITAKAPGYLAEAHRVTVAPGQLQDLDLQLVTLSEATEKGRRWVTWKPWLVVATGGVITATGGVLHALSSRNFSGYDQQFLRLPCTTMMDSKPIGCTKTDIPADLNAQLNRATREQQIAVGAYIAGGSLIAAGIVLVYINRPRLTEQGTASSSARDVTVVPMISTDMLGIQVNARH